MKTEIKNSYELPIRINLRFGIGYSMLFLVMGVVCLASAFIPINDIRKDGLFILLLMKIGSPLFGAFCLYAFLFQNLLKKSYIDIDIDKIDFHQMFGTKTIWWDDVLDISTYTLNHNEFLGFITKQKVEKAQKGGFFSMLNSSMGGMYGGAIPLKQIHKLEKDEIVFKIKNILKNQHTSESANQVKDISDKIELSVAQNYDEEMPGSLNMAILYSSLFALGLGIVYGLSIFIFRVNILIIPIFGVFGIFYYFIKYLKPEGYRAYFRLWTGLLGLLSVFIARISLYFFFNKLLPTSTNLLRSITGYFEYLPSHLNTEFLFVIIGFATAGVGFFISGPSIPIFRKFSKPFLRRHGQLFFKKEEQYYTIYFVSPENFDEGSEKFTVRIAQGCEIEIEKKNLKYFKIPSEIFKENGITFPIDYLSKSNGGKFVDLSFGGAGNTETYAYDCYLIANAKKELEVIKLEIH